MLPDRSTFNRTKIGGKCQNSKVANATFLVIFKHCDHWIIIKKENVFKAEITQFLLSSTYTLFQSSIFRPKIQLFKDEIFKNYGAKIEIIEAKFCQFFIFGPKRNLGIVCCTHNDNV